MVEVMPDYKERPEQLAWRMYGDGSAEFVRAIIYANPTLELSDALILPEGAVIEVPMPIPANYSESAAIVNADLALRRAILNGTATPEMMDPRYMGFRTVTSTHTPN